MQLAHSPRRKQLVTAAGIMFGTLISSQALAAVLTGQVSDATGTRNLAGATVELVELGRSAEAEADGSFRFPDVAPGSYTLRVSYAGAKTVEIPVTLEGDAVVRQAVSLQPDDAAFLNTVLVIGQRANLSSSISRQRAAAGVESVLTRDAMGQFPDQNVAEAVRRAAGVNVLDDQGEGRFVAVRGLSPELNSSSINGVRVPAPEAGVREVALDVIPTELVESIEIKKSLTPDMDGDTLGASVEIKTTSAFDRKRPLTVVSLETSYNDLRDAWSPKGSIDFSRRLGERFGIAGGVSYYDRKFSTDNIEASDWSETDDGQGYAEEVQYRDYDVERKRIGASLSLDWKPSDTTSLYLRSLYSRFDDQEYRKRLSFKDLTGVVAATDTSAEFLSSDDDKIKIERDLKDRFERQSIRSFSLGGKTYLDAWTFDYQAAWSKADEVEHNSLDPITFVQKFNSDSPLGVSFDYSNMKKPAFDVTEGSDAFLDASAYGLDDIERTTLSMATDEEKSGRIDIAREFSTDSGSVEVKFGGKIRSRDKVYDKNADFFENDALTLDQVLGQSSYGLAAIDPVPGTAASHYFRDNFADFEHNDLDSDYDSLVEDFDISEDISAGYLQGSWQNSRLLVIGGARYEGTDNTMRGNKVTLVEEGGSYEGVVVDEDTIYNSPQKYDRDYDNWLPSLNVRFLASDDVVLRGAVYSSLVRPSLGKLAPNFIVEESDDGEREGTFGNPTLKAMTAVNADLSAEWYFDSNAVLQAGYFHKDIKHFIADQHFESDDAPYNGVYNDIDFDEADIAVNGDDATVDGIEFGYQQSLNRLPAPFDGLLLGLNYTWTDATGSIDGRDVPLIDSSKNTWNATFGYEKGPISLRLAGAYRDKYLDELGSEADEDRYVKSHLQWDFTGKYRINPNLQLFAELVNITNEPYVAYQRGPGRDRLLQYEEYSWTAKMGLRANF